MLLYISTSGAAVSAALVEERTIEGALTQVPIYFVSEALNGSKLLYSEMEKMAYAVVMAACKLRYYFQSHKIKVPTSFPLRDMFENREASGRIGKWATQLAEHTIDFVSRSAIKSDSELITGQINKSNRALKPELTKYMAAVRSMERYFLGFSVCSFSRTKNKQADQLAKAAA